jgi:hypothetical protein
VIPFLLLLAAPIADAAVYAGDTPIEGAVHIDITPEGFNALGDVVPLLAPSDLPVDGISDGYDGLFGQCWLGGYSFEVDGLLIGLEFDDVSITPNVGYLDAEIRLYVNVNDEAIPFYLGTMLECIESSCDAWVDPFEVNVFTTIALEIIDDAEGNPQLDATIGELDFDYELTGDDVTIEDCAIGTVLDVFDFIGIDLIDLILPTVSGALDGAVGDLAPTLEETIETAFAAAVIEQELELQGKSVLLAIQPGDVQIVPDGMRLSMDGFTDVETPDACIADYDDGTFNAVDTEPPPLGAAPSEIEAGHAANVLLADEFGNQLLYSVWKTGLLCYTIDDELGFPIDTAILGLLAGEAFKPLFPDAKPMIIETRPQAAPTLAFAGDNDMNVLVKGLGLDFMAELDHRMARVLAMDLEVDAGVDLAFDETSGGLGIEIDLGTDAIDATVSENDFAPEASANIEESFGSVFNGLVSGILGDALGDLNFSIPGFSGIGLTAMSIAPAGDERDWLGGYTWLGEVSYASTGCAEDGSLACGDTEGGGCTDAEGGGCSGGGCTAAPRSQRRWLWLLFPATLIVLRRRD